ncbi:MULTISPECIES: glycosyltransferase family 2 protein [unclassified Pseudoalteromonas]|uniref:glycosyltransferase family 2 protein n=1 Tax=unclassified Pseudoalteromonas TaxID=194690 RepID=UPI001B3A426D|nr:MULTISPECIES: glycosyltransferase family 2 protein [unclassified Pseudoalteromonas]MBQ4844362.1 glycosyltransferase family 2 protein [Pseudoalteromonas sp. MMG005]MBQ4849223.1 glycosyltransferase family 2 protein [Pseudoalteromonas sp. MMG012]
MSEFRDRLVSILIPAYNCENTIEEAFNSAYNQTYQNLEIIVLDDASSDGTNEKLMQLAKNKSNVCIYKNEKNLGYLRTFNKLFSYAKGDYITFLDSDDWISLDKIEKQVEFLDNQHEYGFCGTGFNRTNSRGKVYQSVVLPQDDAEIKEQLRTQSEVCFCGSSVMVRREVIESTGVYREYFSGCPAEDYDWIRRMSNKYKSYNLPEPLYNYRFAVGSLTRNVSYDVKAQSASEIAWFFDKQREKYDGDDALSRYELLPELELFLSGKQRELDSNPTKLLFRKVVNEAVGGEYKPIWSTCQEISKISVVKAFAALVVACGILIIPNDFLLIVKSKFKR